MKEFVTNITSAESRMLAEKFHSDATCARVSLDSADEIVPKIKNIKGLWIDAGVEGLGELESRTGAWKDYIGGFPNSALIADLEFQKKPSSARVQDFVSAVMDKCSEHKPNWISIPQLQHQNSANRNKINRMLAESAAKWKAKSSFKGKLILPVLLSHQSLCNMKIFRNPKVKAVTSILGGTDADGIWVVETSLQDDNGSTTLRNTRFPGIIKFHLELNAAIDDPRLIKLAGPYWGLGVLLWARMLIEHPVIGVGSSFQYFMPGSLLRQAKSRICLPSLRRRCTVSKELETWLTKSLKVLGKDHSKAKEFQLLLDGFSSLYDKTTSRTQLAKEYRAWLELIAKEPKTGRSVALFQDLASAFALGRGLPDVKDDDLHRRPEHVAESLMLSCM